MTDQWLFVGGPLDGKRQTIPPGVTSVAVPIAGFAGPPSGLSLSELQDEIRLDPETFAIIAPPELVFKPHTVHYRLADNHELRYVGGDDENG